jgi:hypothetical protein
LESFETLQKLLDNWQYLSVNSSFTNNTTEITMTLKNNAISIFLTGLTLILLVACGQNNSDNSLTKTVKMRPNQQTLTIDTFSNFPPEIDGCSCYFSNDSTEFKKGEFIYMNDYAQTSFLKINGILTKFIQTDFKEIDSSHIIVKYKSDNYEMTIESKNGIQSGDETWQKNGTIKLTNKKGEAVEKTFYGECGC